MLSGEATNINFIVFGLIRPGLELTIYRTRSEHANHYTTVAVPRDDDHTAELYNIGSGLLCLTPLSRSVLFVEENGVPGETTDMPQVTDKLYHNVVHLA